MLDGIGGGVVELLVSGQEAQSSVVLELLVLVLIRERALLQLLVSKPETQCEVSSRLHRDTALVRGQDPCPPKLRQQAPDVSAFLRSTKEGDEVCDANSLLTCKQRE